MKIRPIPMFVLLILVASAWAYAWNAVEYERQRALADAFTSQSFTTKAVLMGILDPDFYRRSRYVLHGENKIVEERKK